MNNLIKKTDSNVVMTLAFTASLKELIEKYGLPSSEVFKMMGESFVKHLDRIDKENQNEARTN